MRVIQKIYFYFKVKVIIHVTFLNIYIDFHSISDMELKGILMGIVPLTQSRNTC